MKSDNKKTEKTTPDVPPTVEQVIKHICRHPNDRKDEIVQMIERGMSSGKAGSIAQVLSQREAAEAGTMYHGFLGLVERVEEIRKANIKICEAVKAVANAGVNHGPNFSVCIPDIEKALKLLQSAAPSVLAPDDDDDPGIKA